MNPSLARSTVIFVSIVVLVLSAIVTTFVWLVLSPIESLPRALIALFSWVSAYYVGANLLFWRVVQRLSYRAVPPPVAAIPERA